MCSVHVYVCTVCSVHVYVLCVVYMCTYVLCVVYVHVCTYTGPEISGSDSECLSEVLLCTSTNYYRIISCLLPLISTLFACISYVPSTRDVQLIQSHFQLITKGVIPR